MHEAGHQFWYGIVGNNEFDVTRGWTRASTPSPTRACSRSAFTPNYRVQRFFGGFVPWVFRDIPLVARHATTTA